MRGGSRGRRTLGARALACGLAAAVVAAGGCGPGEPPLPTDEEARAYFSYAGDLSVRMSGNVAQVTIEVPSSHFRRGGSLWAKAGPYLMLFHQGTYDLLKEHPGISAVRVISRVESGDEVARLFVRRDAMTEAEWKRGIALASRAQVRGTSFPHHFAELVEWGEDRVEHEYNPTYVKSR